jgi:hypothetical protein
VNGSQRALRTQSSSEPESSGSSQTRGVVVAGGEIVDKLAAAAAQAERGGLPLLSFALSKLWEARDRNSVIPRAEVTAIVGVAGALSRRPDRDLGSCA